MSFLPFVQGIGLGAGMIIPIGAQNSFVLNQAIKRNYHLIAASICIICDVILMAIGVFGGGSLIKANSTIFALISWAGIAFLTVYGYFSFQAAMKSLLNRADPNQTQPHSELKSLKVVIITTLAVTLLNPHVYLDTVVILGSVGGQFEGHEKFAFAAGIMMASLLWFSTLALAAAKMATVLSQPKVKRTIDFSVGVLMWLVAYSLFNGLN